jgi:hypothetical protein
MSAAAARPHAPASAIPAKNSEHMMILLRFMRLLVALMGGKGHPVCRPTVAGWARLAAMPGAIERTTLRIFALI